MQFQSNIKSKKNKEDKRKVMMESLFNKLDTSEDKALLLLLVQSYKDEISELLKDEIVSRYYYQKGSIRSAIHSDKGIQKAVSQLNSLSAYSGYFEPGRVIAMKSEE